MCCLFNTATYTSTYTLSSGSSSPAEQSPGHSPQSVSGYDTGDSVYGYSPSLLVSPSEFSSCSLFECSPASIVSFGVNHTPPSMYCNHSTMHHADNYHLCGPCITNGNSPPTAGGLGHHPIGLYLLDVLSVLILNNIQ